VLNGLQVRSFIHPDCVKRVLTGAPSDEKPDLGAIAAYELGRELPVPYLVLGSSAISGPLAPYTCRAGTTNQLAALLTPEAAYPDPGGKSPVPGFLPTEKEDALMKRYLEASAARVKATRGMRGSNQKAVEAFVRSIDRAGLLREFARTKGGIGDRAYTPELSVQVQVAMRAIDGQLCQSIMMQTDGWDTHADNTMQVGLYDKLFAGLVALADELVKRNALDRTVVVVMSEMGRTPKLNASGGKDHWPVTSAFVFGGGVAGGRLVGGSDDALGAKSIDLRTGAADASGKQVQTGNFVAGVLALAGVDAAPYLAGVEPIHAIAS
jgi:hypothetical protein